MTGWSRIALGDIADLVDYGITASATTEAVGPKFLRITDIQDGTVRWDRVPFSLCDARAAAESRLNPGDIVFARTGATTGKSFLIRESPADAVFASYLIRVRLANRADPSYVSQFFQTPDYWRQISRGARGVAQPGVNATTLKALEIPLPPLPEQRRIAAILDRADDLRAKRRAALAQLDGLAQSVFVEMFGDIGENPYGWDVVPVSTFVAEFQGGKSIEAETGENAVTRHRVLKVSAVTRMIFLPEESKPVSDDYDPPEEHFLKSGDLLFSRANTTDLVGAVAYVDSAPPHLLLPDKLWRFVWRTPATVTPLFVWALFQTSTMRRELGKRATGTSGSMKNISQEKVFGIPTVLPPLPLQRQFADRLRAIERLKSVAHVAAGLTDSAFASLQHRAFRGEL